MAGRSDLLFVAMLVLCGTRRARPRRCWSSASRSATGAARAPTAATRRATRAASRRPGRSRRCSSSSAIFAWAAHDFVHDAPTAPADALPVYVVAKQWMWKLQHRNGRREINELHVPLGEPVRLVMTSQDVIHSFFVPAFRLKQDVRARPLHAPLVHRHAARRLPRCSAPSTAAPSIRAMIGRVVVMEPADSRAGSPAGPQRARAWRSRASRCSARTAAAAATAPARRCTRRCSTACYGRTVHLQDGRTRRRRRELHARLDPRCRSKDVVAGYAPVMPRFAGQLERGEICRR